MCNFTIIVTLIISSLLQDCSLSALCSRIGYRVHVCKHEFIISRVHNSKSVQLPMDHSMSNQHKKFLPLPIMNETQFLHSVSVETIINSEFQHSTLYGFRVRARQRIDSSENFSLPVVTKSIVTSSEITFMTYNLHHL